MDTSTSRTTRRNGRCRLRIDLRDRDHHDADDDPAAGARHLHQPRPDRDRDPEPQLPDHRGAGAGAGAQFLSAAPDAAAGAGREEVGQQRPVDGMAEAVHDRAPMRRRRGAVLQGREGRGHALHRLRPASGWSNPASSCRSAPSSANSACCRPRTCEPRRWNASRPVSSSASATPRSRSFTCRIRNSASTSFVSPAPGCSRTSSKLEQRLAQQAALAAAYRPCPPPASA